MKTIKTLKLPVSLFKLILVVVIGFTTITTWASEPHEHGKNNKQHEEHDHDHKDGHEHEEHHSHQGGDEKHGGDHTDEFVSMSAEVAKQNGIETTIVTKGVIRDEEIVYGKIVADPASVAHVNARFPGVIKEIKANIGDEVKKGETLVVIESNESLNQYSIKAPMSGRIVARQANIGELTNGENLLTIANFDVVWAQLSVFPTQLSKVNANQQVLIQSTEFNQSAHISYLTPSLNNKPYSLALVRLDNKTNLWPIGAAIKGAVTTNQHSAPIVVPKEAIQEFEGNDVVFIKEGNEFRPSAVKTGASDAINIAIIDGLNIGDSVVVKNSYLLVADLKKSEAGHDH
ncbi:HlyD family secretion protein [Saccharobesus litoralis]|uniref:HlyD family secretion protein n=1 Tax=Saccharobesus litoralis TaxID=2172099 RepID=A0A2S0VUJ8_9ALTE|nr:efflux RND transporter periplasmic adaptor subunit [Saccharobesus litoralis]AWB67894.1 HlyD family secretion protein [Saccharobesus litoralis]